jgi:TatD DNase family protein
VTYGEEYLTIYREYINSEGERVVEHEKRKRMDGNEEDHEETECVDDTQEKRRRLEVERSMVEEDVLKVDNEAVEREVETKDEEDVLKVDNEAVEREVETKKDFSSDEDEEFESADEGSDSDESYITVDEADVSAEVLLDFEGSDVDNQVGDEVEIPAGKKGKYCPICKVTVAQRLRRHAEEQHVPWFLSPNRACWTCKGTAQSATFAQYSHDTCVRVSMGDEDIGTFVQLANGTLELLRHELKCSTWEDLLQLVVDKGWYPTQNQLPTDLSLQQKVSMWLWEKENMRSFTPADQFSISPPTSVACLLHYKVLLHILANVTQATRDLIQQGDHKFKGKFRKYSRKVLRTSDAHCHLDTVNDIKQYEGSRWDSQVVFSVIIANFVFPATWHTFEAWMSRNRIYGTVGLHPNICQATPHLTVDLKERLSIMMEHPRCVALGEIGLDYLRGPTFSQRITQRTHFRALLQLKPANLPVILHCRDDPRDNQKSLEDALKIMRSVLPKKTPVMIHCFMGTAEERDHFLVHFPQTIFSISPKCLALNVMKRESLKSAVRGLQLEQIVLESDFPYLCKKPRQYLYYVAQWVGQVKGLCPTIVLEATRLNVEKFFNVK